MWIGVVQGLSKLSIIVERAIGPLGGRQRVGGRIASRFSRLFFRECRYWITWYLYATSEGMVGDDDDEVKILALQCRKSATDRPAKPTPIPVTPAFPRSSQPRLGIVGPCR